MIHCYRVSADLVKGSFEEAFKITDGVAAKLLGREAFSDWALKLSRDGGHVLLWEESLSTFTHGRRVPRKQVNSVLIYKVEDDELLKTPEEVLYLVKQLYHPIPF